MSVVRRRPALGAEDLTFAPLTPERWDDLVDLFGPRGASSGCWCMWLRLTRPQWREAGPEGRRRAFEGVTRAGPAPGVLAYSENLAVGWIAVGPRAATKRFDAMEVSASVDAEGAESYAITCSYVRAGWRKRGMARMLALAAVEHARGQGARAVEVCAIESETPLKWGEGFVGLASVYRALGFVEIARRTPRRPLMRLAI